MVAVVQDPVIEDPKPKDLDLLEVFQAGGDLDYPQRVAVENIIKALPVLKFKTVKANFESALKTATKLLKGEQKVLSEKEVALKVLQVAEADGAAALMKLHQLGHIKNPSELEAFAKRTANERAVLIKEIAAIEGEIGEIKVAFWKLPGLENKLAAAKTALKATNSLGGLLSKGLRRPAAAVVKQAALEVKQAEIQVTTASVRVNQIHANLQPIVLRIERQHAEAEQARALEAEKARKMEVLRGSKSVARPSNFHKPKG